jgi:hypothetical protein
MRNIIILSAFTVSLMTSCATYRNGQTPDDVYFAAEPDNYVRQEYEHERTEEYNNGGRRVRIVDNNRPNQMFNQRFCHDPASMIILNNQCFCAVNGNLIPFIPGTVRPSSPVRQSTVSSLENSKVTEPVRVGKYFVNPKPSNGSTIFKGGSNQNQTRYSNTSENNNSGSRYFQSNSSSSSSSGSSSNSSRSGRRN